MILLIDTSQETGFVALAKAGRVLFWEENKIAKEHASWLHEAVKRLLEKAGLSIRELEAVSVVAGPGSYTGLRVGMAAAKGFCYALKIPLITQGSLQLMAEAMKESAMEKNALICPMIDARREEVFTAVFRLEPVIGHPSSVIDLEEILPPQALILNKTAFEIELSRNQIIFTGSGAEKWSKMTDSQAALFERQNDIKESFASLSQRDFEAKSWADTVYAEPVYLKEFFSY